MGERIARGQLDGSISGGALCQKLAPSMKVTAVPGMFQSREEAVHVMTALNGVFDEELRRSGYAYLASASIGGVILFTTVPVATLDDIRRLRLGSWDLDGIGLMVNRAIGMQSVPMPAEQVNPSFEAKQIEGLATTPTVVLAWQLTPYLKYFLDLRISHFYGCTVIASRVFDRLSIEDQTAVRTAAAKFRVRVEEVGKQQDDELLGGLLAQKGIRPLPVSPTLRNQFLVAARQAREQLGDKLGVPGETLQRVLALLADFRANRAPQ